MLCLQLERKVEQLRVKHKFTVVAVAGSVGKTSTKLAVARLLEASGKSVRYQEGNYNERNFIYDRKMVLNETGGC